MKKQIIATVLMLISLSLISQENLITLSFSGINSNNQTVDIDSVFVENVTQGYASTLVSPYLSITLEYETGIEDSYLNSFAGSKVIPNPFTNYSDILINNPKRQDISITIIDNAGKAICNETRNLSEGTQRFRFSSGKSGIYHVNISNGISSSSLKCISLKSSNISNPKLQYIGSDVISGGVQKSSQSTNDFPYQQGDVLKFTAFAEGYPNISITDSPTSNMTYEFSFSQFFRLSKQLIETSIPCFVDVMFQVTDEDYIGVDNLTTSSIVVKEDNQPVSPTETFMYINKMSSIPYQMKTVLLLDNSASAAPNLEEIKDAAINLVNNLVERQYVAIMVFSDQATLLTDFTNDVDTLVTVIESIELGFPSTDLYGSIIESVYLWNDYFSIDLIQQGFLIALTDGDDTQGSATLEQAINAIGDKRVYMIGLGNEINPEALEELANPEGSFFNPSQANELIEIFNNIQNDLVKYSNSFYWMNYMTPKRDGGHNIKLEIVDNQNTGTDSNVSGSFSANNFFSVYSGVYANINEENHYGVDTVFVMDNIPFPFQAVTYWAYNPPIFDWVLSDTNNFSIIIDELDKSKVYVLAKEENSATTILTIHDLANGYSNTISLLNYDANGLGKFTDPRDYQTYNINSIGNQTWFAENLNFEASDSWWYSQNSQNGDIYGRLYYWSSALTACPDGWHLPTDDEWKELEMLLGMSQTEVNEWGWRGTNEGEKLKSQIGWIENGNGTDDVFFKALPAGFRKVGGGFSWIEYSGFWWTATEEISSSSIWRQIDYNENGIRRVFFSKGYGLSVRCIKD